MDRCDDVDPTLDFTLGIAAVPMLGERRDVTFSRPRVPAGRYYTASPKRSIVRKRMPAALAALDASGAHIGLLPEASCDDALLRDWRRLCAGTPPPAGSDLTFLLAGAGPVTASRGPSRTARVDGPPPNRAVILSRRTGEILALQDKQRGFSMEAGYLRAAGLARTLGTATIDELLPTCPALNLLDSTVGRVAVLVCEDLGRVATLGADVVASAVSLVLAPILATPIQLGRWQDKAGTALVAEGVTVAVANSVALGREHLEWNGSAAIPVPDRPAVTLLVIYPDKSSPHTRWSGRIEYKPAYDAKLLADIETDATTARSVTL